MKTIKIVIEKSADHYSAYADNVDGIYGAGNTPEEAKKSVLDAIDLTKKHNKKENIPSILNGAYRVVYRFDTESILNYYKGILSGPALSRLTGINEKQIHHYATGHRKPRPAQVKKIETALHTLGQELIAVEL